MSKRSTEYQNEIAALSGLEPDERRYIPVAEQRLIVEEAQSGDAEAMLAAVAQRLPWIYEAIQRPELQDNPNLTPREVMHLGMVAVIESLVRVKLDLPTEVNTQLQNYVPAVFKRLLEDENFDRNRDYDIEPVEALAKDRTVLPDSPELHAYRADAVRALQEASWDLSWRERQILQLRYDKDLTMAEAGKELGISGGRVQQIESRALNKLSNYAHRYIGDYIDPAKYSYDPANEDLVNTGTGDENNFVDRWYRPRIFSEERDEFIKEKARALSSEIEIPEPTDTEVARWTPEQLAKQQAWLDEIVKKQEQGEFAWVKGSLLKRSLPTWAQEFLDNQLSKNSK